MSTLSSLPLHTTHLLSLLPKMARHLAIDTPGPALSLVLL